MENTGNTASSARAVIDRLLGATNDHDIDALVGCFAPDYVNETPGHPARGFRGSDQVRRNWTQIFAAVPHLTATMPGQAEATGPDGENLVWTEWQMSGSRRDGSAHLMRGVIIFTVSQAQITAARFYLEPVDAGDDSVEAAVASQVAGRP